MPNFDPIHVPCQVRMRLKRKGVVVPYGPDGIQAGELWSCPRCDSEVVIQLGTPVFARGNDHHALWRLRAETPLRLPDEVPDSEPLEADLAK